MARPDPPLVSLGYGKFARADRIYALVPLAGAARGDGRRTLVYVEGIAEPLVASRAERAIAEDVAVALGTPGATGGGRFAGAARPEEHADGQEVLF